MFFSSSYVYFFFVIVVNKYLNFYVFFNDLFDIIYLYYDMLYSEEDTCTYNAV
jgi:hypothetical protein